MLYDNDIFKFLILFSEKNVLLMIYLFLSKHI